MVKIHGERQYQKSLSRDDENIPFGDDVHSEKKIEAVQWGRRDLAHERGDSAWQVYVHTMDGLLHNAAGRADQATIHDGKAQLFRETG